MKKSDTMKRKRGRPATDQHMVAIVLNLPAPLLAIVNKIAADNFERRAPTIRRLLQHGIQAEAKKV
jgi:metal-responsive CopG/Arc/MetJ family transcriptional regulator